MTTGNVSQASFIINVAASGNTASQGISTGNEFRKVIDNINTSDKNVQSTATGTRIDNGKVRDNVRKEKTDKSETEEVNVHEIEQLAQDVVNIVKDTLEITDEELEQVMSELGITIVDLLVPQNAVNLIAAVRESSAIEIVTDDELSKLLSNLNKEISEVVEKFVTDNNISFEKVVEKLTEAFNNETIVTADEMQTFDEVQKTEIKDSDNTGVVEVTVEETVAASKKVTNDNNLTESDSDSSQFDKKDHESVAHNIIHNISDAVTAALEQTTDVAEVNRVDGVDIVRQIVDSVKVNVTEELQSLEINLNPENLGKLNLVVAAKDGIITASITTQNEAVKNAIENQITMLKEQLNNQGIKVQEVEVTVASHSFDANMGKGDNNDSNTGSNARKRFRGIDEITDEDRTITENSSDLIDSNISLRA